MDRFKGTAAEPNGEDRRDDRFRSPLAGYANYFEVGHNAFEFLLDAGQVEPQSGEIRFTSRIAISPVHAKLLSKLLARSIEQFEAAHDQIPEISDPEIGLTDLTCPEEFERRALDARRRANCAQAVVQER